MANADLADQILKILKIIVGQTQTYLEQNAAINNLPKPTSLPEDWDGLLKEPTIPEDPGDGEK